MPLYYKSASAWRTISQTYANVSSTWRQVPQIYVNINGTWRPIYSFSWEIGGWSECSATCGGGIQTRSVRCKRSDGTYWNDVQCVSGTKPDSSQICNSQACGPTCRRNEPTDYVNYTRCGNDAKSYIFYWNGSRVCSTYREPSYEKCRSLGYSYRNCHFLYGGGDDCEYYTCDICYENP